jgi:hypothetical protein
MEEFDDKIEVEEEDLFITEKFDTPKNIERDASIISAEKREKPDTFYLIFADNNQRERAIQIIIEERYFNDLFRFLIKWEEDPKRRDDGGLEMNFSKHPEGLKKKLEDFFKSKGLTLKEEYEVVEE